MEFGDAFDALMDESNYTDAARVLAGLAGSVVARNGVDSRFDLPDEVYGLGVAGGAGTGKQTAAGTSLRRARDTRARDRRTRSRRTGRRPAGGRHPPRRGRRGSRRHPTIV